MFFLVGILSFLLINYTILFLLVISIHFFVFETSFFLNPRLSLMWTIVDWPWHLSGFWWRSSIDCRLPSRCKSCGQGPGTVISGDVQHGVEMGQRQHFTAPTSEHFSDSRMQIPWKTSYISGFCLDDYRYYRRDHILFGDFLVSDHWF